MLKVMSLALVLLSSCVDAADFESRQAAELPNRLVLPYVTDDGPGDGGSDEECAMTVAEEGPCANACDPDWVRSFLPDGVCVTLECELMDGRTIRIGGCGL